MDPVNTLFSRRTFSRLRYWFSALGYDLADRSLTNRIYLVYFCAFWLAWGIAMSALLGGGVAGFFAQVQAYASPPRLVVILGEYALVVWALVKFWQVSRRSPFVFNEEDAYLLCQTPVSRRKVGLLWFFQEIMGALITLAAVTVILSFALVEWRLQGERTSVLVIEILKTSLQSLLLIIPLQIGWQAALWGVGAFRLRRRTDPGWLRPVAIAGVILFLIGFFIPGFHAFLTAPFSLPLGAAFTPDISLPARLGVVVLSWLYLAAGLAFLAFQSKNILLGRAAQETSHAALVSQALSYGQFDLAGSILLRRRLGTTRSASRLLMHPGGNALFRKDLLQSWRTARLGEILNFVWVLGLSWQMLSASNWALQMVLAAVWTISIGGLAARRLRSDLARWWLLRSLPLRPKSWLNSELALSWGMITLTGWLALAFSRQSAVFSLYALVLMPVLVASSALATAHDILRRSKARVLMSPSLAEENVPRQDIWGVLQGLVSVLIPFGMLLLASGSSRQPLLGAAAVLVAGFFAWFNRSAVLSAYRWIE